MQSQSKIYLDNPIETIRRILTENWNAENVSKPEISPIIDLKRVNYSNKDWILIDVGEYIEHPKAGYNYINTETTIKLNVGTSVSYERLLKLYDEIKRIIYAKRRNIDYDNYHNLVGEFRKRELTDRERKIYRMEIEFGLRELMRAV